MKILSGSELAGFIKERQAGEVRALKAAGVQPKLLIIRDSDNPVITKYVNLKVKYGEDIGVEVVDKKVADADEAAAVVAAANTDPEIHGMIVQLPLKDAARTDEVVAGIAPEKDVDGLSGKGDFDSATATAINWLLAGHDIELQGKKIALVGTGRLVGGPLKRMWEASGLDVSTFRKADYEAGVLTNLKQYDIIVTATGVPHLITSELLKTGATVVDAGTASENGVLTGDVDESVRERTDLHAITPKIGGVGPLTVGVLFEDVITAAKKAA